MHQEEVCAHEAGKKMQKTHSCCAALTRRGTSLVALWVSRLIYLQHLRAGGAGGRMAVLGDVWKRQSDGVAGGRDGTEWRLSSEKSLCVACVYMYAHICVCMHLSVCLSVWAISCCSELWKGGTGRGGCLRQMQKQHAAEIHLEKNCSHGQEVEQSLFPITSVVKIKLDPQSPIN